MKTSAHSKGLIGAHDMGGELAERYGTGPDVEDRLGFYVGQLGS
jgi:hypothetical protein